MTKVSKKLFVFLLSLALVITNFGWLGAIEVNAAEGDAVLIVKLVDADNAGIPGITPDLIYHGAQGGTDQVFDAASDADGLVQFELTDDVAFADEDYPDEYYTIEMPEGSEYKSEPVKVVIKANAETFDFYVDSVGGEAYSSDSPYEIKLTKEASADTVDYVTLRTADAAKWGEIGVNYDEVTKDDFILDVRPDERWNEGHLAGATHVNVALSDTAQVNADGYVVAGSDLAKALDAAYAAAGEKRIVVICNKGQTLAARALQYLNEKYYDGAGVDENHVTYLIGGRDSIPEEDIVITVDYVTLRTADAAKWGEIGVNYDEVTKDDFILDVRPDDKWNEGHIAGATHVNVALSDEAQVKDGYVVAGSDLAKALDAAYAAAGEKRIVVICNKGQTLAARALQYLNEKYYNGAGVDENHVTYLIGGRDSIPDGDIALPVPDTTVPRTTGKYKATTMTTTIDMTKYDKGKVVKVWVPVPQTEDFQEITNVKFKAETAAVAEIKTEDVNGNKMLYLEWDADAEPAGRIATLRFNASRYEAGHEADVLVQYDETGYVWPEDVAPYITKESEYVKWNNDLVKGYAAEAVGDKVGTLAKARAIYEWVIANLERIDNGETLSSGVGSDASAKSKTYKVEGCGYGDTVQILTDLKEIGRAGGHCTDINSTFVALCRAAGIPAREMFGIRMNDNATGGQHCWAEFYLPGTGWVYADPGDVLKAIKTGTGMTVADMEAARKTSTCAEKTAYYWGKVDENRIVLSRGRDVTFNPPQSWGSCNTFGYPAAEVDGERLADFTDAKNFVYSIACGEVKEPVDYVTLRTADAAKWGEVGVNYDEVTKDDFILDVRPDDKWSEGHIAGATHVNVALSDGTQVKDGYVVEGSDLAKALDAAYKAAGEKRIVVICNKGQTLAARALQYLNDAYYDGYGVDENHVTYLIGGRDSIPEDDIVVDVDYVTLRTADAAKWGEAGIAYADMAEGDFILDVRADDKWNEGHLPGATHVNVVLSDETQVKDGYVVADSKLAKALDAAYDAAGEKRIVVICNSGQTLAARTLQYLNVKYYEGYGVDKGHVTYLVGGNGAVPAADKAKERTLGAEKSRLMTTTIDMTKYEKGKVVKVWVPVPQTEDYQTISEPSFVADTATANSGFTTKDGNKMLYLEWDANAEPAGRIATLKFYASRYEAGHTDLASVELPEGYAYPSDVAPYATKESTYVKWNNDLVKGYAAEAVGDKTDTLEKAKAVYDWVTANLERIDNGETLVNAAGESRTFAVEGCGYGDTVKILTDYKEFGRAGGHCTDLNSTFVALCRAAGIPAREMFGIRMNDDATGGQHCWAEFYLPGTGWVYADPGDALKAIKSGKGMTVEEVAAAKAGDTFAQKTAYFWGTVDENRIVLSRGRDVTFEPAQSWGVCNTFGYPAAEVDGERLPDFTDAKNFVYTIVCGEVKDVIDDATAQEEAAAEAANDANAAVDSGSAEADSVIAGAAEVINAAAEAAEAAKEAAEAAYEVAVQEHGEDSPEAAEAQKAVDDAEKIVAATATAQASVMTAGAKSASNKAAAAQQAANSAAKGTADAVAKAQAADAAAKAAAAQAAAANEAAQAALEAAKATGDNDLIAAAQKAADAAAAELKAANTAASEAAASVAAAQNAKAQADQQAAQAAEIAANNGVVDPALPKVSIKAPKKAKKSFTAKWKKLSKKNQKKVKGIELEYSTTPDFSADAQFKGAGKSKTSVKVKKLASKKTYYVRAHTYVVRDGVKYVSPWSKVKKVKVK